MEQGRRREPVFLLIARASWLSLVIWSADLFARADEVRFPLGLLPAPPSLDQIIEQKPVSEKEPPPVAPVARKRFWTAAGELVLLEVGPWAFDRYVLEKDYAYISFD